MQLNKIFLMLALGALTLIGGCAQPRASSPASGQASGSASTTESPMRTLAGAATGESQAANRITQKVDDRAGDPNRYRSPPGYPACRYFDGFKDNGDGTVTDPRDGLIWKRCAEGQTWTGSACSGDGATVSWFDAMRMAKTSRFLNKSDWRLPTKDEFSRIVGDPSLCEQARIMISRRENKITGVQIEVVSPKLSYPVAPGDGRFGRNSRGDFWSITSEDLNEVREFCKKSWNDVFNHFESEAECIKVRGLDLKYQSSFQRGGVNAYFSGVSTDRDRLYTFARLVRSDEGRQKPLAEYVDLDRQEKLLSAYLREYRNKNEKRSEEKRRVAQERNISSHEWHACMRKRKVCVESCPKVKGVFEKWVPDTLCENKCDESNKCD